MHGGELGTDCEPVIKVEDAGSALLMQGAQPSPSKYFTLIGSEPAFGFDFLRVFFLLIVGSINQLTISLAPLPPHPLKVVF